MKLIDVSTPRHPGVFAMVDDADFEAVKKSWRRLAKEYHPDVKPGDAQAAVRFQAIQAAYEVLRAGEERRTWKPRGAVD